MSSAEIEGSSNPEHNLTPAEIDHRNRLEAIARHGLDSYVQVDSALAEIRDRQLYRDSHSSFETYARERWGVELPSGAPASQSPIADATPPAEQERNRALPNTPCEALARACDETLSALMDDDRMRIEIRLAIRKQEDPPSPADAAGLAAGLPIDELLPRLRLLLTQATGTIGEVSHQLESRAADVDDRARRQLRDDVLVLDGELAIVKALLSELVDWDSEFTHLLDGELPPLDTDLDAEDDG